MDSRPSNCTLEIEVDPRHDDLAVKLVELRSSMKAKIQSWQAD